MPIFRKNASHQHNLCCMNMLCGIL